MLDRTKQLGQKFLIGGGDTTQITNLIKSELEVDFFGQLQLPRGTTHNIPSFDDPVHPGQLISFNVVSHDQFNFWADATPSPFASMKQKIRIDNKPAVSSGYFDFGGAVYLERLGIGRRVLNVMAQAYHPVMNLSFSNVQVWRSIAIATDDEMPMFLDQKRFRFSVLEYQTLVANTVNQDPGIKAQGITIKPTDLIIYLYLSLRQDSGQVVRLFSGHFWFKKVGELV